MPCRELRSRWLRCRRTDARDRFWPNLPDSGGRIPGAPGLHRDPRRRPTGPPGRLEEVGQFAEIGHAGGGANHGDAHGGIGRRQAGPLGRQGHELAPVIDEGGAALAPVVPVGREVELPPVQGMVDRATGLPVARSGPARPHRLDPGRRLNTGTGIARPWNGGRGAVPRRNHPGLWTAAGGSRISRQGAGVIRSGGRCRLGPPPARPDRRRVGADPASFLTGAKR
jgi:hypothetical protein